MKTVNYVKCGGKEKYAIVFQKLCEQIDSHSGNLLLHTSVREISRKKVLTRVCKLTKEILTSLTE